MNRWCAILGMILGSCAWGCSGKAGLTFQSRPPGVTDDSENRFPFLDEPLALSGEVPLLKVLDLLEQKEIVLWHPHPQQLGSQTFQASGTVRARWAISAIENAEGWVFDPYHRRFHVAVATHTVDNGDDFGRAAPGADRASLEARGSVSVSFRFRDLTGNLSASSVGAGATLEEFSGSVPEGVRAKWQSVQERSYFEGVQSPASSSANVFVNTQRKTVDSGLEFDALAARLPGNMFRLDGTLTVSSFSDAQLDRSVISLPCQVDGPRGEWVRLVRIRGADANLGVVFRHFRFGHSGSGAASASAVDLEVRVD